MVNSFRGIFDFTKRRLQVSPVVSPDFPVDVELALHILAPMILVLKSVPFIA